MKEKTKLKIIEKIAQNLSLEDKFSEWQKVAVWSSYMLQMTIFQICLLISITEPQLHINQAVGQYPAVELGLFLTRLVVPIIYLVTKSPYVIPFIKLLQMMNIYLIRTQFCAIPLIIQGIAQLLVTLRKQKRNINFDSRLQSKYFGTKIFALYILLFSSFLTPNSQIYKNPSVVFFTSIIYYVAACLDNIYSYRTKQILRNIALCPVLMAIYFMCVPLVPPFSTFGTAAHTIVSCTLMFVIVIYAIISEYSYNHEILSKKILNLESRDKLLYIWSLIYFSESPSHNDLICFIKTHQAKCLNSLCPLNFNQKSKDSSNNYSKQVIQNHLKIYLKKALERFASQSDQVRRLFIYYRKQDDPKLIHLLRQDDIYEKIEQFRISKNLQRQTDPSLQYEQMKEIQEQTLAKVKLYLNHYDYFLTYINKETISMETSQQIIKEILKLKNYFLSFKPNSIPQIDDQKISTKSGSKSKKKGYEKLQTQTIPIRKMTLKTVVLVNFMRKVYFSLSCLQKEEFSEKKLNYISEDFEQSPILIISAQSYNLGKIVNWNSMAQKTLLYSTKQLRTKFINDLLPKCIHKIHQKIFMKAALSIQLQVRKQLAAFVFCFTKAGYTQIFQVKIQGANSISGNKWVVEMKHHFESQAVLVCDEYRKIIGVNKNAINFGIAQNVTGQMMNQDLFNRLITKQKEKVTFSAQQQPIDGLKIDKETKWQLVCTTPFIQDMPKFYIFLIENANDIEMMTLSRFDKNNHPVLDLNSNPQPTNNFQINFDPYLLKYSTLPIPSYQQADLQIIWQQNQSIDQNQLNQLNYNNANSGSQRQVTNYGQNIHQMIYFDSKLQFKQNYQVVTEFETHPYYVPNGRMTVNKNVLRVNISKENFIENVNKIKQKVPYYLFKIVLVFAIVSILVIIAFTFRFLQFKNLYNGSQQKQLISQQLINRKNIISNIGSLAIYNAKATTYPTIWDRYVTNNWTFAQLFVQIQYTNSKINKLNSDIGALVSKGYLVNGKTRTLASYFESLSIKASLQSTGQLNLTQFILQIVDDVQTLESNIYQDFEDYYSKKNTQHKLNIFIIDVCQLAASCIAAICCHFILKKAYDERVLIFKSLSVIQEEEVYRIQKCVSQHREHIKNNEMDAIHQQDYSQPLDSSNIPHSKKMMNNYFKDRTLFFYIYMLVVIIVLSGVFPLSQISYQQVSRVQLVTPFINIISDQRNSMSKLYLNVIVETKNDTWISNNVISNVRMFETNKKGVIDSLIAKKFSDKYLNFYNEIWLNPCDTLGVPQQCADLFSGILSDNLDYNYVYLLTQVEKIIDYRLQSKTPPLSLDPQFVKDVNAEIQTSYKKINFLLFDFMTKLQKVFTENIVSEIEILFDFISTFNLVQFLLIIVSCCASMTIMVIFTYWIKDLHKMTLEMVTTVVPYSMLMRNEFFADWYKNKFRNMY